MLFKQPLIPYWVSLWCLQVLSLSCPHNTLHIAASFNFLRKKNRTKARGVRAAMTNEEDFTGIDANHQPEVESGRAVGTMQVQGYEAPYINQCLYLGTRRLLVSNRLRQE